MFAYLKLDQVLIDYFLYQIHFLFPAIQNSYDASRLSLRGNGRDCR